MKTIKGHDRNTIECICNTCGSDFRVSYDIDQDYYICHICIKDEEMTKTEDETELDGINDWNETLQEFQKEKF